MSKSCFTPPRFFSAVMLAAAVTAATGAMSLGGCMSAVADDSDRGSAHYSDMLIAKAVMDGSFHGGTMREATVPEGVTELRTVNGAVAATAPTDAAVVPTDDSGSVSGVVPVAAAPLPPGVAATSPYVATTQPDDIGLAAATLNQPEPIFNLSLQDAIARALKNALAIRVEAYNPGIRETEVVQAESIFDPIIFGQTQWQRSNEPVLIAGAGGNGTSITNQLGIKQVLPSGATAQLTLGADYRYINNSNVNSNPLYRTSYTDNLNLTITQPLLRGFGADVTEANIYLAKKDLQISEDTFRRQVISTVADVETAYLNLVLARTSVDIQERLLDATEVTYQRVYDRRIIDADAISISQSRAAVEARRAELIRARVTLRNQSDTLKTLLNDPQINIRDNMLINPTDRPTGEHIYVSTADAIETALRQRTELQEARLNVEKANIVVKVAKNGLLPKLDLTVGVQNNTLDPRFDSAFGSTFSSGDYLDFNAGIRLEFPLGNRGPESTFRQRKLEQRQALTQMVRVAQTVVQDVKQQLRDMLSSQVEIAARETARMRAAEELEAITQKERIVTLSPEFLQLKLDSQSRLATAEQNLIQSLVNYNIAIMRFEQSKGTLLEFDRISLDRAPIVHASDDNGRIRFMGQTYMSR